MNMSAVWGPFGDPLEAKAKLSRFTDVVLDSSLGIAWLSAGQLWTIRAPRLASDGTGSLIIYEYTANPNVAPPPIASLGQQVSQWFYHAVTRPLVQLAAEGRLRLAQADDWIEKRTSNVATNFSKKFKSDKEGVLLDTAGVAVSVGLMFCGPLEALGTVAAIGGAALLLVDGAAYITELAGADETADNIKHYSFIPRCIFTLMVLPDAIWNAPRAVRDGMEISSLLKSSLSTSERAAADAARVSSTGTASQDASRAALALKYAAIGAAASKRAMRLRMKLAAYFSGIASGRLIIEPSMRLLLNEGEEMAGDPKDDSLDARILRRYTFHVAAVRR